MSPEGRGVGVKLQGTVCVERQRGFFQEKNPSPRRCFSGMSLPVLELGDSLTVSQHLETLFGLTYPYPQMPMPLTENHLVFVCSL